MPLIWTITIYTSAAAFLVTAALAKRTPWLRAYLAVCVPLSVVWGINQGHVPYWTRPLSLALQLAAVIEAISWMHQACWNPRRRYLCAAFCGLLAIGGTFAAVEYPGFPKPLWWALLWTEVGCAAACFASITLYWWWPELVFGRRVGNVAVMMAYCAVEAVALLWPTPTTKDAWVSIDIIFALAQDYCLLWWMILHYRDL